MHQDGLFLGKNVTNETVGYWGVPPWIKEKLIGNAHKFPWPYKDKDNLFEDTLLNWPCRYFTEEISNGFGRFYQNYNGTADYFADFWNTVADR